MNPWVALGLAAALLGAGAVGGTFATHLQEEKRVETCATGIRSSDIAKCPQRIIDAFSTIQLAAANVALKQRDDTLPVFAKDGVEDAERSKKTLEDVAALGAAERTVACGSAPAMQLLRKQLCEQVGGTDCGAD